MAKIFGFVKDENKKPLEFVTVFKSDANGKPIGNLSTSTDEKGRWNLDGLTNSDYVTARIVGFEPTTLPITKVVQIPDELGGKMSILNIPLKQNLATTLQEFEVVAEKPKPKPTKIKTPKKNWGLTIAIIVAGIGSAILIYSLIKNKNGEIKSK